MKLTIDTNEELKHVFNQTLRYHIGAFDNYYTITADDKLLVSNPEILYQLVLDILNELDIKIK